MSERHTRKRYRSRSSTPAIHQIADDKTDKSEHRSHRLPPPYQPISSDDFFTKSLEFKFWLKNKKNKFIDQIESSQSKKYFEKFVRQWNKGKLDQDYYNPPAHWRTSSGLTSSHSWTFKDTTVLEREKAKRAREEASIGPSSLVRSSSNKPSAIIGPTLPPTSSISPSYLPNNLADYQYKVDQERESNFDEKIQRKNELNRKRKEERDEEKANRATGKERLREKRKEQHDARSEYQRERDDPTSLEIDDRNLFGSSNSFQDAVRARDRALERRTGKNSKFKMEKQLILQEKMAAMKSRESETMAMFKAMADSKFGQGSKA